MPRKVERRKALVYSSISTSREVSNLTLRAALFFTWLLPSLDDQGRILVDSKLLKAVVVPMMDDITARRIPKLLAELEVQSPYSSVPSGGREWRSHPGQELVGLSSVARPSSESIPSARGLA